MADVLSVSEAAHDLGVSKRRVRALIEGGKLPAGRVGRNWVMDRQAVVRFAQEGRREGRPLSHNNAWALLALLSGERPSWIRNDAVSRLGRSARDPDWLIELLRHSEPRSEVRSYWVPAEDHQSLDRYQLVRSGLSARRAARRLDVLPRREEALDVYASEEVCYAIERRLMPEASEDAPNLIIRIPSRPWVLQSGPEAPLPVVAADLLGHRDPRVRRAAEAALRDVAFGR
jgi:excisionase family DNA binding protein